jgi:hypothetical protein
MEPQYHYAPVSEAVAELRKKGFTEDFNLQRNCISCNSARFAADEFEIAEIYKYEGESDPADEAMVYGIILASGVKGVLVTGDEINTEEVEADLLRKLHRHYL